MEAKRRDPVRWFMTIAFLASPLFALLDFGFDLNARAAFLEDYPGWRIGYYIGMTALGLVMVWIPVVARPLGIVEAGINVALTALMVFLPYRQMLDSASQGGSVTFTEFPLAAVAVNLLILMVGTLGGRLWGGKIAVPYNQGYGRTRDQAKPTTPA